jgi:hypothetical protein
LVLHESKLQKVIPTKIKLPNDLEQQNSLSTSKKSAEGRENIQRAQNLYNYPCGYSLGYKRQIESDYLASVDTGERK